MNARAQAVANENAAIDASQSRAIAARDAQSKPRNALEAMASRLQIQPANLKNTLVNTVFAGCQNESQFMALVVVANEYGLNPMLKEIYAFPAKGQGIVPMVSIDGWIRIMNEHPAFDGIEFEYTPDTKGGIEAIEAIIYRKDRSRPIKVIEYLEECKRNTDPWNKSPRRMLRHRALMQGARVAFGFSGLAIEGDEDEFVNGGTLQGEPVQSLPTRNALAEELGDEIPSFDKNTGEVVETDARGMSVVDEKTARDLDAAQPNDGTLASDNPTAAEGPSDDQRGEEQRPEADHYGAKPSNAQHGDSWWDGERVRYARDTPNGLKWYLSPADANNEPQPQSRSSDAASAPKGLPQELREHITTAKNTTELDDARQLFNDAKPALSEPEIKELRELIATRSNELA